MTDIKTEVGEKLTEFGFSYKCNTDGIYILRNNDTDHIVHAHLTLSEPVDEVIHGSRNNNKIQAIGSFRLRFPPDNITPEFLILAFQNISRHCVEFIIIPSKELKRRLLSRDRISTDNQEVEIVFWLMPDNCLYETTNVGVEGEWFYISKGVNGRMADSSNWDYTEYHNNWKTMEMI